jgi:DHA2 family multidrug resistance protein-like MFS transporter
MTALSNAPPDMTPSAGNEDASDSEGLDHPRRGIAIGAVLSAMAMVVIDSGLTNVALPTLADSLRVPPSDAILVVTTYQVAVVMTLLPCAALGESFGYRRVFSAGVGVFSAASLASALAPSLPWLIGARFAQGLGGAAILALGVALLRFSVSDARLGAAIGWNALTVALAAAAGPAIGALIISVADWHWLYVANILLGLAVLLATRALPFVEPHEGRLDGLSILLNCAVFGFIAVAANLAVANPIPAAVLFLAGTVALVALVRREKPRSRPLIPIDLLRRPSFSVSIVASVFCFTGQTAGLIALPFYLQHGLGQTPAMAGLYLTAWPLSVAATAPFAGRIAQHAPTGWVCAIGAALLASGLAAIALGPLKDDLRLLAPFTVMCGVGFGLFQVANNRNMFLVAPSTRSAAAGGMQGTARLVGQTAGALLVAQLFALLPLAATPQVATAIGASFAFAAGLVSLFRAGSR